MADQTLTARVDRLEEQVAPLTEIPGRMDRLESQVLQLRTEMRTEFSAVRAEMQT